MNEELKIIMVAPGRGMGKTSLLAAMHEEFDKTFERANLDTWPLEGKTLQLIEECKQVLRNIDPRLKKIVTPTPSREDPWDDEGLLFEIGSSGKKFMRLKFTDPSGEYFRADARPEQKEYVKQQLNECDAVIIPIDATALMEKKTGKVNAHEIGTWHEEKNEPQRITRFLKDAYQNVTSPRLVILAPIKCETYMKTSRDAEDLLAHVKMGYRQLLDFLRSDFLIDKVAVVVTPVQTIGSVSFAYHQTDEQGRTTFHYYKTPINAPYEPRDGDQPLRYVLRFLLNVYLESKKELLEKEKGNLKQLEARLDTEKDKLDNRKRELIEKQKSLDERNNTWWLLRGIFNLIDDKRTPYNKAKEQFDQVQAVVKETQNSVSGSKSRVETTQTQIEAFNKAIFSFALGCKNSDGFAVIQGSAKWLPIPKHIG
ncbi:hypothetical protein ACE1B6_08410 [Aerosakkonemataceae cyanobacterium BLCC-F154]|uniref:Double-GTPase 2 domain-containing protein n=1 Tax=Floridaenema fluviatile BLCC-F154 TaxID=3153640 RepID=A0ABV4Y9T5_9CYAN